MDKSKHHNAAERFVATGDGVRFEPTVKEDKMRGITLDDGDIDRMEEECLRKHYGDEEYERMKSKKERRSGFDAPAYGMVVPEGARLVELENGKYKLIMPGEEDKH